jgi:hypothetical protein
MEIEGMTSPKVEEKKTTTENQEEDDDNDTEQDQLTAENGTDGEK